MLRHRPANTHRNTYIHIYIYIYIYVYVRKILNRQEVSLVTFRCQVKISQLTAQDQRNKERKVNNLDMRAALIVAASPPDYMCILYIYIYT